MKDPHSIRSFYKSMIALRADSDILKFGTFRHILIKKHLFIYERELNGQSLLVMLNFSDRPRKIRQGVIAGDIIMSSYNRKGFDGLLQPYEAIILKRR